MSSEQEKNAVLAKYVEVEQVDNKLVHPRTGRELDTLYSTDPDAISIAFMIHERMYRDYPSYKEWWKKGGMAKGAKSHMAWLDKAYSILVQPEKNN